MKSIFSKFFAWILFVVESLFMVPTVHTHPPVQNMAKVKFSALIAEMRNKLNGSVFSRNRGGNYLRNKVTPVNPQSAAQVAARSLLTSFSQSWRGLTESQRDAWNSVVDQWATTDVFGDIINPSGIALYIRLNANISNAGGAAITSPPTPSGAAALTALSVTAAEAIAAVDVAFAPNPVPADHAMYLESTPNISPGINNANSRFRNIAVLAPAEASPYAALAEWSSKFGTPLEGQKIFVRAKFINQITGEVSQKLVASTIVAA